MCLAVYLTSTIPLPPLRLEGGEHGVYVSDRVGNRREVQQHASGRHVYYVGSATGCGCGFIYDGLSPGSSEYLETQRAYRDFAAYLREHASGADVEILVYWGGDEHLRPQERRVVALSTLADGHFEFEERVAFTVSP